MLGGAVLLVEDDLYVQRALIRAVGTEVEWLTAETAAKAIVIVESGRELAGAIVDVRLPDGSGFDVARRIREVSPKTAILMVSAHDPHDLVRTGFALDVPVMTKPLLAPDFREWRRREALREGQNSLEAGRRYMLSRFARRHDLNPELLTILRHRIVGMSNRKIAAILGIQTNTLKKRLSRFFAKTGVRDVDALMGVLDQMVRDE